MKSPVLTLLLAAAPLLLGACAHHPAPAPSAPARAAQLPARSDPQGVPELERWERQMASFGSKSSGRYRDASLTNDEKLANYYYDAAWVAYQMADYAKGKPGEYAPGQSWESLAKQSAAAAAEAAIFYRDQYVMPSNGNIPGFWNFTNGLTEHFLRTGDVKSKQAVLLIAQNAAYARAGTPLAETQPAALSREVAYAIMAYLNAERLGAPSRPRLKQLVDQAFGHLDQWFVARSAPFVKPFMVGLTAHALIMYQERHKDDRVVPALSFVADRLWEEQWVPNAQAFWYISRDTADEGKREPSPDLNNLIAPLYAWLYHETDQARYREQADQIFAGGVRRAWLDGGKQFNQSYRWSFDYLRWRQRPASRAQTA